MARGSPVRRRHLPEEIRATAPLLAVRAVQTALGDPLNRQIWIMLFARAMRDSRL
jgi:hypothetical protein